MQVKFFKAIWEWVTNKVAAQKEKKARRKQKILECVCYEAINITEFNGKIYIAHNGVPIVPASSLNIEPEKAVAAFRKDYLSWKSKFGRSVYEKV